MALKDWKEIKPLSKDYRIYTWTKVTEGEIGKNYLNIHVNKINWEYWFQYMGANEGDKYMVEVTSGSWGGHGILRKGFKTKQQALKFVRAYMRKY